MLVRFKAAGLWYTTINTGRSPKFLSDIQLWPQVRAPAAMVPPDWSLHVLQQGIVGVDVGVGQLIALVLCLGDS